MSDQSVEEAAAFRLLAEAYPHETYEAFPERFWTYFQGECPGVSREQMERMLEEANSKRVIMFKHDPDNTDRAALFFLAFVWLHIRIGQPDECWHESIAN